jgi:hypothetical protein
VNELEAVSQALPDGGEPDPAARAAARQRLLDELAGDRPRPRKWPRRHGQAAAAVGLVAILAGAVVVAGLRGRGNTPPPAPSAPPRTTAAPPATQAGAACAASELTTEARAGRIAATGHNPLTVQILETGRDPCLLPRRVGVTVLDDAGAPLPFRIHATRAGGQVRVTPIAPVELDVDKYRCDAGDRTAARTLLVDLGASGVLRVSIPANVDLAWCGAGDHGSTIEVSSLAPFAGDDTARRAPVTEATRVDVGVACLTPNSVRCGRIGIAVFASGRLERIEAQIGRYRVALHETDGGYYQGFVDARDLTHPPFSIHADPAGRWYGYPPATVDLRLTGMAAGNGQPFDVTQHVLVAAGWG